MTQTTGSGRGVGGRRFTAVAVVLGIAAACGSSGNSNRAATGSTAAGKTLPSAN